MNTNEQKSEHVKTITAEEAIRNSTLQDEVKPNNELKEWLVGYVGERTSPDSRAVTVENIVEVLAKEFPEFLMAVAEENWIRGYHQALHDIDPDSDLHDQKLQEKLNPETEEQEDEDG